MAPVASMSYRSAFVITTNGLGSVSRHGGLHPRNIPFVRFLVNLQHRTRSSRRVVSPFSRMLPNAVGDWSEGPTGRQRLQHVDKHLRVYSPKPSFRRAWKEGRYPPSFSIGVLPSCPSVNLPTLTNLRGWHARSSLVLKPKPMFYRPKHRIGHRVHTPS